MMKPASNHISDPRRPLVNQRVVVTGTGVCSSIALNTEEFADALRPHMKDVFVIDYWGTPPTAKEVSDKKRQLKHAVFLKFKDDADPAAIKTVEEGFAALPSKIDSIKGFEWGLNNSPEGKNDEFTHAFMVTFDSEDGRKEYLPHPDHLAFVEVLKPVLDKVRVLDFWIGE